jgi:hypothetical protein
MAVENILAYYDTPKITAINFLWCRPLGQLQQNFLLPLSDKLECLPLFATSTLV